MPKDWSPENKSEELKKLTKIFWMHKEN